MVEGCTIVPIKPDSARALVERIDAGELNLEPVCDGHADAAAAPLCLLAHCDDGVTWGVVEKGTVRLSTDAVPAWPTPKITSENLQQCRVFGAGFEVLIWRHEDQRQPASFGGRLVVDWQNPAGDPATAPRDGARVVAASRVAPNGSGTSGFTAVAEGNGRTQVVPMTLTDADFGTAYKAGAYPLVLRIREYFERDGDTGCIRLAASRLVSLEKNAKENGEKGEED